MHIAEPQVAGGSFDQARNAAQSVIFCGNNLGKAPLVVQRQSEFAGNPKMRSAATDRHHPAHLRPLFARIGMGFATFDA
ncbi:hypothetical protein L2218_22350, partial [Xanthomonas perforans]|uniref:hypothetical protein n=1 Tax=Xanthomonas perforans TaxID=442694 RepID=UPI001F15FA03